METANDKDICVVSVEVSVNTKVAAIPGVEDVPHDPNRMKDEEPDLDALAASFASDQPDRPQADSVQVESLIDQEVMRIQPNTQEVNIDYPGLGCSQLFSESAEHVLTAPKVGNRHPVYGPTLAPADKFMNSQVQIARGDTVGVHTFSQLMFDIVNVEEEWARVCSIDAHTILHRSTEVVRAAKRLPAHRLEPHAEFSTGVFWKFLPSTLTLSAYCCRGLGCVDPQQFAPNTSGLEDSVLVAT